MRTYLVTGGAGFIGSHIAQALLERGDRVRVLDNLISGTLANLEAIAPESTARQAETAEHVVAANATAPADAKKGTWSPSVDSMEQLFGDRLECIQADLNDASAVARAVAGVECVFHQAALASVPRSVEFPLDTNAACVTGTVQLLEQARRAGVKRVMYAASSSAYGDQPYTAKRECDPTGPLSPYAAAKLAAEHYCQAFYRTYGLETVCLRYFNVFGPRQDPNSPYSAVIPIFITKLLAGVQPVLYGDGQQSRDFTYISNVVQGNLLAAEASGAAGQTINVASGKSYTLLELLAALNRMLATEVKPLHEPARAGDVRDSLADITLARQILKYEPCVSFEEGLQRTVDYYRAQAQAK